MRVKLRRTLRDAGHLDRGRLRIKPRSAKIPPLRTSKRYSCCGRDDTKRSDLKVGHYEHEEAAERWEQHEH
jgi:hypothetical protein